MKRYLAKLPLFLLLGMIANIAIALSGFFDARLNQPRTVGVALGTEEEMELWNRHASAGWPPYPATSAREARLAAHIDSVSEMAIWENGSTNFGVTHILSGFPLRCFSWEEWWGSARHAGTPPGDNGLHIANLNLPRQILWLGFVTNTLLYSLILWTLFVLPFVPSLRRHWRIKRGLCPACGYDLRGRGSDSKTCPECGKAADQ